MLRAISFLHNPQMSLCRRLIPSIAFKTPTQHPSPLSTPTRRNQLCIILPNQSKHSNMPMTEAVGLRQWAPSLAHPALTRARSCLRRHWALGRQICREVHFRFRQRRCRCDLFFFFSSIYVILLSLFFLFFGMVIRLDFTICAFSMIPPSLHWSRFNMYIALKPTISIFHYVCKRSLYSMHMYLA